MTTPIEEKLRPSPQYRYAELSREHLEKAAAALANDDSLQTSEEIGDAVASALKALCQERGWNHRYRNHLRAAALYLVEEWRRPDFNANFRAFEDLHTNNYEHQDFGISSMDRCGKPGRPEPSSAVSAELQQKS